MRLDWVHLHLMINHFPVVLGLTGALAGVAALVARREGVWTYAAVTILLAAILAPAALLSGQRAEHAAEDTWFVSRSTVHEHEEAGEKAMWLTVVAGIFALVALRWRQPRWRIVMVVLALAATGAMGYAAFEGGKIVHNNPALENPPTSPPPDNDHK